MRFVIMHNDYPQQVLPKDTTQKQADAFACSEFLRIRNEQKSNGLGTLQTVVYVTAKLVDELDKLP